jgi:hypothetical protein
MEAGCMKRVVARYPLPVRSGVILVCLIFAAAIVRSSVSDGTIIVAFGALSLSVAILAYRAEVDEMEVRIRYAPFFTRRTLIRDVTHLVEGRTLVLITPTSKIPLWGLSPKARETLFQIFPHRLSVLPPERGRRSDSAAATIRKHQRLTISSGIGFFLTAVLVVPFFKGNVWHEYWNRVGQYLLLLCLLFFIALIFEAGFTWVLWSTKREIDRIEHRPAQR